MARAEANNAHQSGLASELLLGARVHVPNISSGLRKLEVENFNFNFLTSCCGLLQPPPVCFFDTV